MFQSIRWWTALITYGMAYQSTIDKANNLLWVAHKLERFANRVSNICERTVYVVTGEIMDFEKLEDQEAKLH